MISSEVQRTLVKSPPELWAELSDPSSLGRHLGELGEIRITRAEPEKLVEWETEAANGTVAIKASAWGTKVTLTANRRFEPPEAAAATDFADAPDVADAGDGTDAALPVGDEAEVSGEETQPTATAAARFSYEHPESLLGGDLDLAELSEPDEESEAAEESELIAEPEAASDPQQVASSEAEPEPAVAADIDVDATEEPELEPIAAEPQADPEPRPGFFARLFGRRRQKAAAQALAEPAVKAEPVAEESLAAESEAGEPVAEEPFAFEPTTEIDEPTAGRSEPEPLTDRAPLAETLPEAELTGDADAEPEPEAEPDPEPAAATPAPLVDLASELRAAEEAAEAEVREILTGVLDRLGAAHHRPFSRS
jgi:hypothetical protein